MFTIFPESKRQLWSEIRGWLLPQAAQELYKQAAAAPRNAEFVEIGSYAGKSTVCIMQAMADHGVFDAGMRLTAMDLRFQPDFHDNIVAFGHQGRVNAISGPNIDAFEHWHTPIAFLYIDGHHGKGHALADLILWDIHVVNGGIVALDDTAGFMEGPNLQIQAAIRSGAYGLISEIGGISFLRKNRPILPVGEAVFSNGALMAQLHAISAGVGAMDPLFRLPRYPRQNPMPLRGWLDVLLSSSMRELARLTVRKAATFWRARIRQDSHDKHPLSGLLWDHTEQLERLRRKVADRPDLMRTLAYLDACFAMRRSSWGEALEILQPIGTSATSEMFQHYDIPIASMAMLRTAQCHDLRGATSEARSTFEALASDNLTPVEIRELAARHISLPFHLQSESANHLLREYNLELYQYKRPVFGRTESI
jgi:hypothetical protein